MKRWGILWLGLTYLCILSGCGLKSIIFPNLGWLVTKKINDSFGLASSEKKNLKKDVIQLLHALKPQVRAIQEDFINISLEDLNVTEVNQRLRIEYKKSLDLVVPVYVKYLSQLNKDQIDKFKDKNKEQNEKIKKSLTKMNEKIVNRIESFLGELSDDQKNLIKENIDIYIELNQRRLNRRLIFQKELYSLFGEKELEIRQEKMKKIFVDYSDNFKDDSIRKKNLEIIDRIIKKSSKQNKKHFRKKIKSYNSWIKSYLKYQFIKR